MSTRCRSTTYGYSRLLERRLGRFRTRARTGRVSGMDSGRAARLVTLGRLTLLHPDGSEDGELVTRKRKLVLLTLLAVSRRPWTRDALVDLFWGEQTEERARHSLSDALSHLRRVLGPDSLTQRRSEVALGDSLVLEVDALDLQAAARAQRWDAVVALHGGRFLDGVHAGGSPRLEQWIDAERLSARRRVRHGGASRVRAAAPGGRIRGRRGTRAARWLEVAPTSPHAALFRVRAIAGDGTPEGISGRWTSSPASIGGWSRSTGCAPIAWCWTSPTRCVRASRRGSRRLTPRLPLRRWRQSRRPWSRRTSRADVAPVSSSVGPLLSQLAAVSADVTAPPRRSCPGCLTSARWCLRVVRGWSWSHSRPPRWRRSCSCVRRQRRCVRPPAHRCER